MISDQPERMVTASEIAEIARVGPSAVSNWKTRHPDFPPEGGDGRYRLADVLEWLEKEGKRIHLDEPQPVKSLFLAWSDSLRADLPLQDVPEITLQLLVIRHAEDAESDGLNPLRGLWPKLRDGSSHPRDLDSQLTERLATAAELHRALRPSPTLLHLDEGSWTSLLNLVDRLGASTDGIDLVAGRLLEFFSGRQGARFEEYTTTPALAGVIAEVLRPIEGTIYDPAAGTAQLLAHLVDASGGAPVRLYGQEVVERTWRLGFLHLLLLGVPYELELSDSLVHDRFWELKADRIALDAPIGAKTPSAASADSRLWPWGTPSERRADLAWVQHAASHLSPSGLGAVTVGPGALAARGLDAEVRRRLVQDDLIDAVIQLPTGLVHSSNTPVGLIVLDGNRSNRSGRVLFVDAGQLGTSGRRGRQLERDDIEKLGTVLQRWREGRGVAEAKFSAVADMSQLSETGFALTPQRYIEYSEAITEIEHEPIAERYHRLTKAIVDDAAWFDDLGREGLVHRRFTPLTAASDMQVVALGEILSAKPIHGTRQLGDENDTMPFISVDVFRRAGGTLRQPPTEETSTTSVKVTTQPGDLLLQRSMPSLCRIVDFSEPSGFADQLILLRPNKELVDPVYLRFYLASRRGESSLAAAGTGGAAKWLHLDALGGVQVALPPLSIQREAAAALSTIEARLDDLDRLVSQYRQLFDAAREGVVAGILGVSKGDLT